MAEKKKQQRNQQQRNPPPRPQEKVASELTLALSARMAILAHLPRIAIRSQDRIDSLRYGQTRV